MTRKLLALLLPMTFGMAACGTTRATDDAGLDRRITATCPRTIERPGDLPPRTPFTLPDGRVVVPIEQADARENMLTAGALVFRRGWLECRSVVIYAEERDEVLTNN